jgi:hypothetical protein
MTAPQAPFLLSLIKLASTLHFNHPSRGFSQEISLHLTFFPTISFVSGSSNNFASNLEACDWRVPLFVYLKDPRQTGDRDIRRQALKYTLLNDELYRRTIVLCC